MACVAWRGIGHQELRANQTRRKLKLDNNKKAKENNNNNNNNNNNERISRVPFYVKHAQLR